MTNCNIRILEPMHSSCKWSAPTLTTDFTRILNIRKELIDSMDSLPKLFAALSNRNYERFQGDFLLYHPSLLWKTDSKGRTLLDYVTRKNSSSSAGRAIRYAYMMQASNPPSKELNPYFY